MKYGVEISDEDSTCSETECEDKETHPLEIQFTVEEILKMSIEQQQIYFEKLSTDSALIKKVLDEKIEQCQLA